jgi:hypothetical protein
VAETPKYKLIGQIVASLDAGKRVDEGLVTHV